MAQTKRILVFVLVLVLCIGLTVPAMAEDIIGAQYEKTAGYVAKTVASPGFGSIGGDWAVLGLARGGYGVKSGYFEGYYERLESYVKSCEGVLHKRKYTEYSRVALAVTAIGKDARDVAGYNLLLPLGDYEKTVYQGVNGAIFALLALDAGQYEVPVNTDAKTQATRELYVQKILGSQLSDGGWNIAGTAADADLTAMALQALAGYTAQASVKTAVEKGVAALSKIQGADGGFSTGGAETCESNAQVLVALAELGISLDDSRFVKNGNTALDALLTYANADGSFRGPLSAEDALVLSRNIPAVDLEKRLSPGLYEFLKRAGVELPHDKNWYGLSLVLGGAEITMADAAKLYAMVAGEGLLRPLRLLEAQASPAEADVLSREAQFVLRRMLASRGESVTIRGARRELLYKTGTSNGWRDAWTAGMVGPYVIVVWLGDFAGRPNPQLQGAHLAAPLFRAAALRLGNIPALDWPAAVSAQQEAEDKHLKVALEPVCAATGDLNIRLCSRRTNAWILPGRTSVRDSGVFREIWIDKETGLRACGPGPGIERRVWEFWPTHFQKVFLAAGIAKEPPPPYTAQCAERLGVPGGRAPVITSPKAGAAIYSPAGFDAARVLLAAGADPDAAILYWYADGAFLGARRVGKALEWSAPAGTHELAVVDDLGRTSTMRLTIRRR